MIKAAIDIGTVTTRLLIADCASGNPETLECHQIITNIGEGLTTSGLISDFAQDRLMHALLRFKEVIGDYEFQYAIDGKGDLSIPVKAVATSAMRDAANASEVLAWLHKYGFNVEVISGTREAELSFKGTLSGFSSLVEPVMSIDVGGGSTELILGTSDATILNSHSFDIGSRRITEIFLAADPPSSEQLLAARSWIAEQTAAVLSAFQQRPSVLIAVAGTATSAITIRDGITRYDRALVHGKRLTKAQLEAIITSLSLLKLEDRKQVPGLDPGRAPVIIGGLITLATLMEALHIDSLVVSDTDILQGILLA
ncbi:MAG: Ppx/GppA family phosphatase [Coriobacteriia bacterium]|nr:Ppx/GppA family phosphatase [Coriobacteriia bacterium]